MTKQEYATKNELNAVKCFILAVILFQLFIVAPTPILTGFFGGLVVVFGMLYYIFESKKE